MADLADPVPPPEKHPTPDQLRVLWTALTALAVISLLGVAALAALGFISFLNWSYPILLPIGLAVIVALVLDPFVHFVQKRGASRETATLTVCLCSVVAFIVFWAFILPPLVRETGAFFNSLPDTLNKGVDLLQTTIADDASEPSVTTRNFLSSTTDTNGSPSEVAPPAAKPTHETSKLKTWLTANMPAIQESAEKNILNFFYASLGPVGQAFGFILGFGFVPIYVYYFLADQDTISKHWHDYVPLRRSRLRDEVVSVLQEINTSLVSYFRGQIIVAACNGVLTFIGLALIGVPYSLVLGIITGVLSIVPFLGIICSIIPALLLAFLSAKGDPTWQWLSPLLVIGVFSIVQMSESMFITPRVQSHSTGLHPLAIILGILFWSLLLPGLLGPIVAVPLTCAIVVLLRRYVWLEKH